MLAQDTSRIEQLTEIQNHFADCAEWLLSFSETSDFAVEAREIEIAWQNAKLVLSCPTMRGWQHWTIAAWEKVGEKLIFQTARKLTSASIILEFTPRIPVENLREDVQKARLLKARELAELARITFSNWAKIERVSLNQSNQRGKVGTIARILLALPNAKTVAVCSSIIEKTDAGNLLSNSILWLTKLEERRKISELWLVGEGKSADDLQKLHALLRDGWREKTKIYQRQTNSQRTDVQAEKEETEFLEFIEPLRLTDLWTEKSKKLLHPKKAELSETAKTILQLAPEAIDVLRSKHGETLRFHGLPFVRISEILGGEQVWFGTDARRKRNLNDASMEDFSDLLENLREHRQSDTNDKLNAFYKAASESWLESILRRDVSRLDPNLVLAPLYSQFRLSNKKGALDLLALRTDGRLVVIELKTTADREHVFQAVTYWQQIEVHRRCGNFQNLKLFGDLPILDAPPLVYLVAPLMSFHRDFEVLANAITPEIEIWRFDLNEDWRGGIRVARRRTNFRGQNDNLFL
ncbi:MAG: hypothetical protein ABI954_08230 [Pyrinomonadaceae bacterium]